MSSDGGGSATPSQRATAVAALSEGVSLVLSRWTALKMAVQNEWGGRDSSLKAQDLADSIVRWFSQSNDALYIDDLENMLDESLVLSFNAEIEDGSVEEVAEQLMIMHEECFQGKLDLLCKLRESTPSLTAISQSRQIIGENDDEESSDDEGSDMMVDEPIPEPTSTSQPKQRNLPDGDGWSVVAPRKGRGKR